jgi:hypothetical protein
MTLGDLGLIANPLPAIGVLVTLVYFSRQARRGNMLAKAQARQHGRADVRRVVRLEERPDIAYHEVIALHLGIPRARKSWQTVARIGFDPRFVAEIDAFLAQRPTKYVAVVVVLLGWAIGFRTPLLGAYALAVYVAFHLRVGFSLGAW